MLVFHDHDLFSVAGAEEFGGGAQVGEGGGLPIRDSAAVACRAGS